MKVLQQVARMDRGPLVFLGLAAVGLVLILIAAGCNPIFWNQMSGGSFAPLAPGDTAFVLAHAVNDTRVSTTVVIGFDAPTWVNQPITGTFFDIEPGTGNGILIPCPVDEIGLGPLDDPSEMALQFSLPDGGQVTVPASAFPFTLLNGVDYECGDTVLFTIIEDQNSVFGVTVVPSQIEGSTQTGPFSGPDTFSNLDAFLQMTTQLPVPAN